MQARCPNCKTVNPVNPAPYFHTYAFLVTCSKCHIMFVYDPEKKEDTSKDFVVGAIAGAAIGSAWGPPGLFIGGILGGLLGASRREKPREPKA